MAPYFHRRRRSLNVWVFALSGQVDQGKSATCTVIMGFINGGFISYIIISHICLIFQIVFLGL